MYINETKQVQADSWLVRIRGALEKILQFFLFLIYV